MLRRAASLQAGYCSAIVLPGGGRRNVKEPLRAVARASGARRASGFGVRLRAGGGIVLLLSAATAPAWAQGPQSADASPTSVAAPSAPQQPSVNPLPKWGPFLDLNGLPGTQRNIGMGDLFVPLAQSGSSMLFTDLRGRFDDRDSREGNFGLGARHMLASGWNLGVYGYYDRTLSDLGGDFGQATLGAEALSLDWDLRANVYRPVGPSVRTISDTTSTTSSDNSSSSAAIVGPAVQVTTTTTTTVNGTRQVTQEVEQPGFDAEIGWRVPLFDPGDKTQLRVYAGGYRFSAVGVRTTEGPRGRFDLTVAQVPHLWQGARFDVGAEVQHDAPRGTQAFALLRLRIPLQIFASAAPSSLTPMEWRMEDPIERDVDVVTQAKSSTTSSSSTASSSLVETAGETASGSPITVLSSASTTGAALPGAVAAAGANATVILSGSFTTSASLVLQSGQTVLGSGGLSVKTATGHTATLTTPSASVTGNLGASNWTVTMANNSTLSGVTVNTTDNSGNNALGVKASGVSGASIINNTINATQTNSLGTAHGVDVLSGSSNITVSGNTITASGGAIVLGVQVNNSSATVTGNNLRASGATSTNATVVLSTANVLPGSSGNVAKAGSCDVNSAGTGATVTFTNAAPCGP
jgi:hypothetical protein